MVRRNSKDAQNPLDNIADAAPAFDKKAAAAIPATLTTESDGILCWDFSSRLPPMPAFPHRPDSFPLNPAQIMPCIIWGELLYWLKHSAIGDIRGDNSQIRSFPQNNTIRQLFPAG